MIWLTLLCCALLVFASRYLFLEPKLPVRLGRRSQQLLSYSAPAVLSAIAAPLIFIREQSIDLHWHNPYLACGLLVAVLARYGANALVAIAAGMGLFLLWPF
ncbi:AzlD domain-containing protein [Ferrimonas sp. YFM]|uniref:AzlD domain-containing protein n=1 Tax=Ferrimonas sp. YFM TaxID=3028878 RepID=UPI0025741192|nr:AzlD domain-containing protein [Ferrimonas sp. YFM]BDY05208.1 branched-chain amino acid ABC transporter [Ferrimonas sp. YFM]